MFLIPISNHPTFNDITRAAEMRTLSFDEDAKHIIMCCTVRHFIDAVPVKDLDKQITLTLKNERQYPDGQGGEIGDYDFFYAASVAGASLKALVEGGIANVDSEGIIDTKCQYK